MNVLLTETMTQITEIVSPVKVLHSRIAVIVSITSKLQETVLKILTKPNFRRRRQENIHRGLREAITKMIDRSKPSSHSSCHFLHASTNIQASSEPNTNSCFIFSEEFLNYTCGVKVTIGNKEALAF